nr:unnamed protein product [Callosobruchus chinensis]
MNMLVRPNSSTVLDMEHSNQVLLSTIVCQIADYAGGLHTCRALLDSGAQSNLITEGFCSKLNIPLNSTKLSIIGINQTKSNLTKKCEFTISSNFNDFSCKISCLVVPTITLSVPSQHFNISHWSIPDNLNLADPGFECPREVDLLLGANIFWDLLLDGKISLGKNMPTLRNTRFGWILTGTIPLSNNLSLCNFAKVNVPEDEQLTKFWELENVKHEHPLMSKEDMICESLFKKDTFRLDNGQFVVKLPLKHSPNLLGDSKTNAIRRFHALERKFSDSKFKDLYFDFIHEYADLGHMRKITDDSGVITYFLPHHGILKESVTTKLRTVFDGSCPSSSGWSLNDLQYIGPKVQNDIIDILLRFRTYTYVVSADVSKMYRQILIHPDHRSLQQILWRESPSEDFSVYQLQTVTYGTRAAPYLAIRCIRQLAEDNSEQFPLASKTILEDIYVDDVLTGSNDLKELKTRCNNIYSILQSASLILRKWNSNCPELISDFEKSTISNSVLTIGNQDSCKTLGIQWTNHSDTLSYKIKPFQPPTIITKRYILSTISQIYDPLGLLGPSIIVCKIMIQKLWSLRITWDAEVPPALKKQWLHFHKNLSCFNSLLVPRNAVFNNYALKEIHCFCDASKDAYATCIYMRSVNKQGDYNVQLLCAKTKVAPLKSVTIPKLELCACLLGSLLVDIIRKSLNIDIPVYIWSDSQVALCWIHTEPHLLQTFVANRVAKIQSFTQSCIWNYVSSKENPADLASRGVAPEILVSSKMWWTGPEFLKLPQNTWPLTDFSISLQNLPEIKKNVNILHVTPVDSFFLFTKFSNLSKLIHVTAFCLRFTYNLKNKLNKHVGILTPHEIDRANVCLLKLSQSESFSEELSSLKKDHALHSKHKFSSLSPFLDDDGIIRVGGRLKHTYLPFNTRHPVLLSSKHIFTKLIFDHKHKQLLHPGPQLLLASIRHFYWPIGGTVLAKRTVKNCLVCFKFKPTPFSCPMSSLPNDRIQPQLPFHTVGIDYAGPFNILNKKGRGAKLVKCYLVIFICFCTKAIHAEAVTDLTTDNFLACLRRFTSRRGIPSVIYSDNGSTFVGANNKLKTLGHFLHRNQTSIVNSTTEFNIKWMFIPPYTPNHGGLWEAAVKSMKHHLLRTVKSNVTYEEFNTLIIQAESILNSRPLFALSSDPNDLAPVTPSHFLIGKPLTSIPEPNYMEVPVNRLLRLQHVQQLYQRFWFQFSKQYVSQLHQQYKWKGAPSTVALDSLVLVKNDFQPPCRWPLGRVLQLFPGKDGVSRIAEVKTLRGTVTRSLRHLCPLPAQNDIDN